MTSRHRYATGPPVTVYEPLRTAYGRYLPLQVKQMERVHWIVERSAAQGKTVYEDRDEFMRRQQEAQDDMWGVRFEPLVG